MPNQLFSHNHSEVGTDVVKSPQGDILLAVLGNHLDVLEIRLAISLTMMCRAGGWVVVVGTWELGRRGWLGDQEHMRVTGWFVPSTTLWVFPGLSTHHLKW